jgi:hypothetical protein
MIEVEFLVALVVIVIAIIVQVWLLVRRRSADAADPKGALARELPQPVRELSMREDHLPSELLVTDLSLPRAPAPVFSRLEESHTLPRPRQGFVPPPTPMSASAVASLLGGASRGIQDDAEDFRATIQAGRGTPIGVAPSTRVGDGALDVTHIGETYTLGIGDGYYGIWYRRVPGGALKRFPKNSDGWFDAWAAFEELEPQCQSAS